MKKVIQILFRFIAIITFISLFYYISNKIENYSIIEHKKIKKRKYWFSKFF